MYHHRNQNSNYLPYQHASLYDDYTGNLSVGNDGNSAYGAGLMMRNTRQNVLPPRDSLFPNDWSASSPYAVQPNLTQIYPLQISSSSVTSLPPGDHWLSGLDFGSQVDQQSLPQSCHDNGFWLDLPTHKSSQVFGQLWEDSPCEVSRPASLNFSPIERQPDSFNAFHLSPLDTAAVDMPAPDVPSLTQGFQNLQPGAIFDPVVPLQQTHVTTQSTLPTPGVFPDEFELSRLESSPSTESALSITTAVLWPPSGRSRIVEASVGSGQDRQHREIPKLQSKRGGPCSNSFARQGMLPRRHMERAGTKRLNCPDSNCDFTASSWKDILRHGRTKKHMREIEEFEVVTFACVLDGCTYNTQRRDNLTRHVRTHQETQPLALRTKKGRRSVSVSLD